MGIVQSLLNFRVPVAAPAPQTDRSEASFLLDCSHIDGIDGRTPVTTSFGPVPAKLLRVRDTVLTRSGDWLEVQAIDEVRLDEEFLHYHPDSAPVRIAAGSLGCDDPSADLWLAPGQHVSPRNKPNAMQRAREFEVAGDSAREPCDVTYYRIDVGTPSAVGAAGFWLRTI